MSCTALESVSSSTGLGCQGNSRHSMSFSTSTRPCRVITSPLESSTIRVGMPAMEKNREGDQPKHELASDRVWGERPLPMASGSGRSPASLLPLCSSPSGDQAPWILLLSQQSTAIPNPEQLWHCLCLSLPSCRQGLLLSGAHGYKCHCITQGPSLLCHIPVLRCGCFGRPQFPELTILHTAVARKQGVFLPRRTPRILAPTALQQHSALMAQPFPQHIPLEH